jgi:hypothetical protein
MANKPSTTIEAAPAVKAFLKEHGIGESEAGVAELVQFEVSLEKMRLNRSGSVLQQRLGEFLAARATAARLREAQERERARMQVLAMELSQSPSLSLTACRNDQHLMRYPLFSTSRGKRLEPIEYQCHDRHGNRRYLTVTGNAKYGMADQRDADIVRYALSKLGEVFLKTGYAAPSVRVSAYELLQSIGKDTGQKGYLWLRQAMRRLAGMLLETNILTTNPQDSTVEYVGSLVSFEVHPGAGRKAWGEIAIHIAPVLYRSAALSGLLCIEQAVMREQGNLRKALLERIQVFIGDKQSWSVELRRFAELCAIDPAQPLWRFREDMKRARLPYGVRYHRNSQGREIVTFFRVDGGGEQKTARE